MSLEPNSRSVGNQPPGGCSSFFKLFKVEKPEEQALEYFQNQFFEAYGGAWTTKVDWFFHSVKHF